MVGNNATTEPPMLEITGRDILNNHMFFLRAHFPLRARCCLRAYFSLLFSDNNLRIFRAQIISCIGGIEPGSISWQATILPLHHRCLTIIVGTYSIIIYFCLRALFPLRARFRLRARFFCYSDNNLLIFRAQITICIGLESNPSLSRGRRQFYD